MAVEVLAVAACGAMNGVRWRGAGGGKEAEAVRHGCPRGVDGLCAICVASVPVSVAPFWRQWHKGQFERGTGRAKQYSRVLFFAHRPPPNSFSGLAYAWANEQTQAAVDSKPVEHTSCHISPRLRIATAQHIADRHRRVLLLPSQPTQLAAAMLTPHRAPVCRRWLPLLLLLALPALAAAGCTTDHDCSLNGRCAHGACACARPWTGAACAVLERGRAASRAAAAVYGYAPNMTSWGGNILAGDDGRHHLYVTEIAGGCGLGAWGSHSLVAHAVSTSGVDGPYRRAGVAIPHQSHNPQAMRYDNGTWLLFHIFPGSGTPTAPCPPPPAPPVDLCKALPPVPGYSCHASTCGGDAAGPAPNCGAYHAWPTLNCSLPADKGCPEAAAALCNADSACKSFSMSPAQQGRAQLFSAGTVGLRANHQWTTWVAKGQGADATDGASPAPPAAGGLQAPSHLPADGAAGSELHQASSPDGPWTPVAGYPGCNNPSPWRLRNGSILVICTWKMLLAPAVSGPWTTLRSIPIAPSERKGVPG